jgi:hypothetical protein
MTSDTGSNPEDEYADDEYADCDAEDREQPSRPTGIPTTNPKTTCSNSVKKSHTATTTGNGRYSTGLLPRSTDDADSAERWRMTRPRTGSRARDAQNA